VVHIKGSRHPTYTYFKQFFRVSVPLMKNLNLVNHSNQEMFLKKYLNAFIPVVHDSFLQFSRLLQKVNKKLLFYWKCKAIQKSTFPTTHSLYSLHLSASYAPMLRILDIYPGSGSINFPITDPGYYIQKKDTKLNREPAKIYPGSEVKKHRIQIFNTAMHRMNPGEKRYVNLTMYRTGTMQRYRNTGVSYFHCHFLLVASFNVQCRIR
jgi:hypothetical protein